MVGSSRSFGLGFLGVLVACGSAGRSGEAPSEDARALGVRALHAALRPAPAPVGDVVARADGAWLVERASGRSIARLPGSWSAEPLAGEAILFEGDPSAALVFHCADVALARLDDAGVALVWARPFVFEAPPAPSGPPAITWSCASDGTLGSVPARAPVVRAGDELGWDGDRVSMTRAGAKVWEMMVGPGSVCDDNERSAELWVAPRSDGGTLLTVAGHEARVEAMGCEDSMDHDVVERVVVPADGGAPWVLSHDGTWSTPDGVGSTSSERRFELPDGAHLVYEESASQWSWRLEHGGVRTMLVERETGCERAAR